MNTPTSFETYLDYWTKELNTQEFILTRPKIRAYTEELLADLESKIIHLSTANAFEQFSRILGIDAKLFLLYEFCSLDSEFWEEVSEVEWLALIDSGYKTVSKEMYEFEDRQLPFLIFNVS